MGIPDWRSPKMFEGVSPDVALLTKLLVFYTLALFAAEAIFNSDTQFFQVIAGMYTGIGGCLLGFMKGSQAGAESASGQIKAMQDQLKLAQEELAKFKAVPPQ